MDEEKYFETIKEFKLLAKKEVGQNFLIDRPVARGIVEALNLSKEDKVLEVGSGAGSLSFFLANSGVDSTLIDIDESFVLKLREDFASIPTVHPLKENAMRYDFSSYSKIVGNLPYYITSGIIERILLNASNCEKMVLMVQKEAFIRIFSKIGNKDYGPLPLLLEASGTGHRLFSVSPTSFVPAPHVDSVVFSFEFDCERNLEEIRKLYDLLNGLFVFRRKTIFNNLRSYLNGNGDASLILEKASIPLNKRPEELSLEDFKRLLPLISNKEG